jgi:hypothetical protein
MAQVDQDEVKRALKEALKEWLDDKFLQFGKWSAAGVAAAILSTITYFILTANGWHQIGGGH